jgi:trk system potassium uptake protein TrkH
VGRAVFHAVSAFCNAGFALQSDNLEPLRGDVTVNLVVPALIVLGGLGFVVLADLADRGLPRTGRPWGWKRLQVHTRLVICVSLGLVLLGAAILFFAEFNGALQRLPLTEKAMASFFLSVSSRTAGFNTVPMGQLAEATLFVLMLLMFVGGSPGSTAGGIKTTTLAILLLTVRSVTRGRIEVEVFGRTVPRRAVYAAVATAILSAFAVTVAGALLATTERAGFVPLLFEAVSAFGTVGLSTGITPELTPVGKGVVTLLMFVGRLGPLTLALAMARRQVASPVAYPEAGIQVG